MVHNCSIKRHCKEFMLIILLFSHTKDLWHVDVHVLPRTAWHFVEPLDMTGHGILVQNCKDFQMTHDCPETFSQNKYS